MEIHLSLIIRNTQRMHIARGGANPDSKITMLSKVLYHHNYIFIDLVTDKLMTRNFHFATFFGNIIYIITFLSNPAGEVVNMFALSPDPVGVVPLIRRKGAIYSCIGTEDLQKRDSCRGN